MLSLSKHVGEAIRDAAACLAATSDTARLDAEVLMAHALGITRSELLLRHLRTAAPPQFAAMIERRAHHEPVAYITGRAEFYGLELEVSPAVLIPRADSETLIEAARTWAKQQAASPARILDLGTGSGALLVAALTLFPEAEGIGIDASPDALAVATANARRLTDAAASFRRLDWTVPGWTRELGRFELILANPPYVEQDAPIAASVRDYEPAQALFSGPEGLDDYRLLIPALPALLAPGGAGLVEIGHCQAAAVTAIGAAAGLRAEVHRDLGGRDRVVAFSCG